MAYTRIITAAKQNLNASPCILENARELRKNMTPQERKLWKNLKNRQLGGMHFRRQHRYGKYIIDFYCFQAGLAIELDGPIHLYRKKNDQERTKYIESTGLTEIRFRNEDVDNRIEWVIKEILKRL